MKTTMKLMALIGFLAFAGCLIKSKIKESNFYTELIVNNISDQDSVKVFLTLQSPNSVVGYFGIQEADTTGSKSQGYFYAFKDSSYSLLSETALMGWNISFETPPMSCSGAIQNGYPNGINIVEGSINCGFEVFDISCVDGANCVIDVSVSDTLHWSTGMGSSKQNFRSTRNVTKLGSNCNIRGVFPYRCNSCNQINPKDAPPNCFDLPDACSSDSICQVARTDNQGGSITISYVGK
jgi:hypothetical protein